MRAILFAVYIASLSCLSSVDILHYPVQDYNVMCRTSVQVYLVEIIERKWKAIYLNTRIDILVYTCICYLCSLQHAQTDN